MGGPACVKAAVDGGRLASTSAEVAAEALAFDRAFEIAYPDLKKDEVDEYLALSQKMCDWAAINEKWTAQIRAANDKMKGAAGGYPVEGEREGDAPITAGMEPEGKE